MKAPVERRVSLSRAKPPPAWLYDPRAAANRIGQLVNEALELAPLAGLTLEVTIKSAPRKPK